MIARAPTRCGSRSVIHGGPRGDDQRVVAPERISDAHHFDDLPGESGYRMTLAFAGFVAGFLHVLSGPDHLAAVAPFAVDGNKGAWRTGIRWGLGHTAGVLGIGMLALALRLALPVESFSAWGERCVGLALVAIGIWGTRTALARRRRRDDHLEDPHSHRHGYAEGDDRLRPATVRRVHGRAAFAVGTLHGLAGSSHLLGILPALALPSDVMAGTYLILFGAGSIAGMGTFASFVGWIAGWPAANGVRAQAALLGLTSIVAVAVGGCWILSDSWFIPRTGLLQ